MRPSWRLAGQMIWLLGRLLFRIEVIHAERIPAEGPMLVAPTHTSFLDPPLVAMALGHEAYFLAREGILKTPLIGAWYRHFNTQAIRRGASDRQALKTCRRILEAGWPLIFFPEGTRSSDGRLGPIRGGFAMILERLEGVPYLPVVIQDTYDVLRRGWLLPRPRKIRVIFGEPAHLPPREQGESSRAYHERCAGELKRCYYELGAR